MAPSVLVFQELELLLPGDPGEVDKEQVDKEHVHSLHLSSSSSNSKK